MHTQTETRDAVHESLIVDAHLDVAWNAIYHGRDLTLTVAEIRKSEPDRLRGVAMTSLASMSDARVGLVFATLLAQPAAAWSDVFDGYDLARPLKRYTTPEEAETQAIENLELYERWAADGLIRLVTTCETLDDHLRRFQSDRVPGFLILMEGADPIVRPDDLPRWWNRGLRMVSLAWGSTRYAGGTGSSGPLTDLGHELLAGMADVGMIHDASHLSEEAFWEAAGASTCGLCVTHASPRSLMLPSPGSRANVPLNRHLSDAQIREVGRPHGRASAGVIGLAFLGDFLEPSWWFDTRPVEPRLGRQGAAQLQHVADLVGWDCVGIGSDVDSGFGRDETAIDLDSIADWRLVADSVPDAAKSGVLGGNWVRFLREVLPAT